MNRYRYYQKEADVAIYNELLINNKCIVKMFCGTGKSLLMRKCKIIEKKKLVVYVFPSLGLIDQFCTDYFVNVGLSCPFKISSENESTTDPIQIKAELKNKKQKIICVTYQSYKTLLDNLDSTKIDVCIYDEAHHAVGETYQKLIFENDMNYCEKQIFFTATPKNANGIVMYDRDNLDAGMCGNLVYDYSYLKGVVEDYLNPFEIRMDMYTENTNNSVFESIARAILVSGNNRVLTFHSDVNTDRDTSVKNFVNEREFKNIFKKIQKSEFPEKKGTYKNFKMIGLYSDINMDNRRTILDIFDTTPDDEVMVISSCETIGEGIDTKNANMCVFVDPKSSYVKIIQNIGRIVRKIFGSNKPNSTILIPCWVDKTKYLECGGDKDKCDEVIRQDMSEGGNFNGILNVMSALKQEDEDIYDICLHYPDCFSPGEIRGHWEKHGYKILEPVGDGKVGETVEYLIDEDIDYEDYEDYDDEEMIMRIAEDHDICIEIHTDSLETPVETYNSECESGEIIRLYKCHDEDEDEDVYHPIVKKCGKRKNKGSIQGLNRNQRVKISEHTNPDVKVLWNIVGDFTKDICSCILDCEVVKYDPMEVSIGIVERANKRVDNGLNLLPTQITKNNRITPELEQEYKDATKLGDFKKALKGKGYGKKCPDAVRDYLDEFLPEWRTEQDFDKKAMEDAKAIVERANKRDNSNLLPKCTRNIEKRTTPDLEQQEKDARKLGRFKDGLKGKGSSKCPDAVRDYLDENLPGWRQDLDKKAMEFAKAIVERAKKRDNSNLLPRNIHNKENRKTPELEQENTDARKLGNWKKALKGKGKGYGKCPDAVRDYLDEFLPEWRKEQDFDKKAMEDAKAIVERAKKRDNSNLLPKQTIKKNRITPELKQQHSDAVKLMHFKTSLKGTGSSKCPDAVRDYLDENLLGWRKEQDFDKKAMEDAKAIVDRANKRVENKLPIIIKDKKKRTTPELEQQHSDAVKLIHFKTALKGKSKGKCPDAVRDYLDKNLPEWRTEQDFDKKTMEDAKAIVERANQRFNNKLNLLPRYISNKENKKIPELHQELLDYKKLYRFKTALKGKGKSKCPDAVRDYLDKNLPGWRNKETEEDTQSESSSETPITKPKKSMKLKTPSVKKETIEQRKQRTKSELSILHQRYKTLTSQNLQKEFQENPQLWTKYHEISEENESSFPEQDIPRNRIIQELDKIKTKRTKKVVDMGCGKAQIANHFEKDSRFQFINYDHISSSENIETCDISNTPLEENDVEICILSLAMWGSNCKEYIQESHRILETGGKLYIIEATKRWTEEDELPGNKLKKILEENGFQIVEEKIEKFCMFVCIKV